MHTLALCAMALVFMADIKIDQRKDYVKPHIVKEELNTPQLPDLSVANVKEQKALGCISRRKTNFAGAYSPKLGICLADSTPSKNMRCNI